MEFEGKRSKELLNYITKFFENTNVVIREVDGKRIGLVIGERHYLRTFATASYSILLLQDSPNTCEVYIISAGGASRIGIDLGARDNLEEKVAKDILKYALDNLKLKNTKCEKPEKSYSILSQSIFEYHPSPDK